MRIALVSAPLVGWVAAERTRLPLVGTFHAYSDNPLPNWIARWFGARRVLGRLHVRIAVSEAAAWTGRRWFGGDYRIIPNGVHVDPQQCLRVAPGPSRVHALGKADDETKHRELGRADVLCAPSLGGESFGMVLTEAFAAGTPAVASDIAGYRDVLRDGVNGVLVPPAHAHGLAEALRNFWVRPGISRSRSAASPMTVHLPGARISPVAVTRHRRRHGFDPGEITSPKGRT